MNVHPGLAARDPARPKGPLVFLDMDQQALDEAYDQEIWAPNRALIVERRKAASERARAILGMPKRVAYGSGEHEGLDIFDCGIKGAPINVFVHGGAWRRNIAADYAAAGRAAGARRRAFRPHRLHQCRSGERRSVSDVRAGAARARLGLSECRELRRRPRPPLYFRAFVGLASVRRGADARLEGRGAAAGCLQGRGAVERHVRSRAGAAVEALVLCEVHRRDGRTS